MSIYKHQRMLWALTEHSIIETKIDRACDMMNHTMRCSVRDWFSARDFYSIFEAREVWQQEIIDAALLTLQKLDKVRYNEHNHKVQYRPVHERNTERAS